MGHIARRTARFTIGIVCFSASHAFAQRVPLVSAETPRAEVAVTGGLWSFDQFGQTGWGGRLTVNRRKWLGGEMSLGGKREDENTRAEALVIVNARLIGRVPDRNAFIFATAGGAAGAGLDRIVSPMIGAGVQSLWQSDYLAARAEIQYFPGGAMHYQMSGRLMLSVVVAIR